MPAVSEAQRRAMYAAAAGKSTIGIPQSVGKEFTAKDDATAPQIAAGVIFVAPDGAVLLLCRSAQEENYAGHWCLPGGKAEDGETPWLCAVRECEEEIGSANRHAWLGEPTIVDEAPTPNGMVFTTFVQPVRYRFTPEIDAEHCGYVWSTAGNYPSPMHPQVARVLGDLFPSVEDENAQQEKYAKRLERLIERRSGGEEAMDAIPEIEEKEKDIAKEEKAKAMTDEELKKFLNKLRPYMYEQSEEDGEAGEGAGDKCASDSMAMDRATVRTFDQDGHMKVSRTPITKAVVSPYRGSEIPNWQTLGLEPDRVYQLYRDAEELAKAVKTFEGKPVLKDHIAASAAKHPKDATVGAIGSPVEMVGDTLYAPLSIWDQEAIDEIESEDKKNLSCSYRYTYDPTPGTTPAGMPYDGRMVNIQGNHVALVENPRVPGSMVADNMPAGLAATIPNSAIPAGGTKRAAAHEEEEPIMADKTAKDRAKDEAGLMERLKGKISEDEYKALDTMLKAGKANDEEEDDKKASDETEQEKKDNESEAMRIHEREEREKGKDKAKDEEKDEKKADDEEEEKVSKTAMDSAISKSVSAAVAAERKAQAAIRDAERFVQPWVGNLSVAFDSADAIYRHAIEAQGRDVKDVHPSAYRTILEMLPKPGSRNSTPRVAMDSAKSASGFAERFPDAAKISVRLK